MEEISPRSFIDEEAISRIVEEGRIANPYNDIQKLVSKVNDIFPYLVSVAQQGNCTDYWTAMEESGVFTARQSQVLGVIGLMEDENGRPLLSAVVTQTGSDMVGEKYFWMVQKTRKRSERVPKTEDERREMWLRHLNEVYEYWST